MQIPRRHFLYLAAAAAASGLSRPAFALDYPTRPVRIIDGFGGGSTPDLVSRLIGQWLSEPPASALRRREPDRRRRQYRCRGRRTLRAGRLHAAHLRHVERDQRHALCQIGFRFSRATIVPVAGVIQLPMVLLVNPSFPARTLAEFIAYAKANPGKVNFASPGIGTPMHVAIELLKMRPASTSCTCPIAGRLRHSPICWPGRFRPSSSPVDRDRFYQDRQIARLGGHQRKTGAGAAGRCGGKRGAARLRRHGLGRILRAKRHAAGHRRDAQQHYHRRACRPAARGKDQGSRRRDNADGRRRNSPSS